MSSTSVGVGKLVVFDWKIAHSYSTNEANFEGEFSLMRDYAWRFYDGVGNYINIKPQRNGTDVDPDCYGAAEILPEMIVAKSTTVRVSGEEYRDVKFISIWKKGVGGKVYGYSTSVTVGVKITSNATITEEVAGSRYRVGNLYIRVLRGTASLDTGNNILTVSGSEVHISVGFGAYLDIEDTKYGFIAGNMSTTMNAVSSGFKITTSDGDVYYFRWDELGRIIELKKVYDTGLCVIYDGIQHNLMRTTFGTRVSSRNVIVTGLSLGYGFRSAIYIDSDEVVDRTYLVYAVPSRIVFAVSGKFIGFAYEGKVYRATGELIAEVYYSKTIDLANHKALVTRVINGKGSAAVYQAGGATVSLAIEGSVGGAWDYTPDDWGYKYYNKSSRTWVERTSLPSAWYYDPTPATEFKYVASAIGCDIALIVVARSLRTNRSIEHRGALAYNYEHYMYPQLTDSENISDGDYIKEIYVVYYGRPDDYGSTLESIAEIPETLDSKDFNRTLNDISDAQAYGFDTAVIYDPSTDTYSLATAGYPKFVLVDITPTSVNVKVGSTFTVTVVIRNEGTAPGTCKVSLINHEGAIQDEKSKVIEPGQEATFTLTGVAPTYVTVVPYRIKWEAV